MEALMLLCDAAQVHDGKLYILGGGYSIIWTPNRPTPMTVAVRLAVPWDQSNTRMDVVVALLTEDGEPVDFGEGPVQARGNLEVGRPAGIKPGTPLDVPLALPFGMLSFRPGGYVWVLSVGDDEVGRAAFRVMPGQPPTGSAPASDSR